MGIFFGSAFGLDAVHVLLEMVMLVMGVIVLLVEGADKLVTNNEGIAWCQLYRGKLFHFARFLFVPIGRGYFYLYISAMLLAQYPDPVDLFVFFYMFAFTIFCLHVGYQVGPERTLALFLESCPFFSLRFRPRRRNGTEQGQKPYAPCARRRSAVPTSVLGRHDLDRGQAAHRPLLKI